ncbi:mucin-1 isoform X2 [Callorhinus ursinus]|uniref:mucin-1 isoform X2 n=1 Tax=Callorhinus ursinus TaxID=34884 RepID=UPI003CD00AB7
MWRTNSAFRSLLCPFPTRFSTAMTPGFWALLFLLLLVPLRLTASRGTSPPTSGPASGSTTPRGHHGASSPASRGTSPPTSGPASGSTSAGGHHGGSSPASRGTSPQTSGPPSGSTTTGGHHGGSSPASRGTSPPTSGPASGSTTTGRHHGASSPASRGTSPPTSGPASGSTTPRGHHGASSPASRGTSPPTSGPPSGSTTTGGHHGGSSPASRGTSPQTTRTIADTTHHSIEPPTSSNGSTSPQLSLRVSFFFLSFSILNLQFNSSLEDPSTKYYQELQRNISELFLQIYEQEDFLGLFNIKFRPGSVVVESTLVFRKGATDTCDVKTQFEEHSGELARYNLSISGVSVQAVSFPSAGQSSSGVPGWGIALLVLVCVLVALAILYVIALAVCRCCQKNCGQLDLFPTRDAYHPMSEYPTYHTHGRYVPPGGGRSPYEEVSAGNGGSGLSYVNLNPSATSANL